MKVEDDEIALGSGKLFARSWWPDAAAAGETAAIILLHDSLGSVELWRDFPERLAQRTGRRVVAYDRLGFGRASSYPGKLAQSFITDEVEQTLPLVRQHCGIGRFVLFGHSIGGVMSVVAGVRMPGECVAIITEAGQSFTEAGTMDGLRQADENFRDPEQFARLARYHGEKAQWVLDSWVKTWLSPAFANWTLAPELEKLRVPLLALHGDQDEYGSTEHARRLVEGRPEERRMAILKGCGHVPHRDNPELVLDEVAEFLAAMP